MESKCHKSKLFLNERRRWFVAGVFVLIFICVYSGRSIYRKYDSQFLEAEGVLQKINDFEKE